MSPGSSRLGTKLASRGSNLSLGLEKGIVSTLRKTGMAAARKIDTKKSVVTFR